MSGNSIIIRDTTLREGLDVPGLNFSLEQQLQIVSSLNILGIKEIEIGSPGQIIKSALLNEKIKEINSSFITSGLIFGFGDVKKELKEAKFLDRIDLLMPLVERGPKQEEKINCLIASLNVARAFSYKDVGVGFPHATLADLNFIYDIACAAVKNGATRIIIYDTNGSANPQNFSEIIIKLRQLCPLHIHCHNDRGLALANSLAAIKAGAEFVDATFAGIGDRAGNAAIEPLIVNLEMDGFVHHTQIKYLKKTSDRVSQITKLRSPLFPATGDFSFHHCTKTHLQNPELFEAFPPHLIGAKRKVTSRFKVNANGKLNLLQLIKERRSIRNFQPRMPDKVTLKAILKSASLAPSSMDGQPWHFVLVEDKKQIQEIWRIKNEKCPPEKNIYGADFLKKAPLLIVVCVDKAKSFDREIETAVLATQNLMLAASILGLGTTYLSAFRQSDPTLEKEIKALLKLPDKITPVTIVPLGYPAEKAAKKKIININSRMHYNVYANQNTYA